MERVGMKREATFRGHVVAADDADRRENTVHYGILREEWEAT
jgi:RimJ/RimL family protein N-acetyltransferase